MADILLSGRRVALPTWPSIVLPTYAILATLTILQGVADIAVPSLTGKRPFEFLFQLTHLAGAPAFAVYIFLHNLGLACLVPGFGFVAVRFERKPANRRLIGLLLAGSVIMALLVSAEYLVQANDRFDLWVAVPLFLGEVVGVLVLAIPAARELRAMVPTRRYEWSLMSPLQRLTPAFLASTAILATLSAIETKTVMGL